MNNTSEIIEVIRNNDFTNFCSSIYNDTSILYFICIDSKKYILKCINPELPNAEILKRKKWYCHEASLLSSKNYPSSSKVKYPKHYVFLENLSIFGKIIPYGMLMEYIDGEALSSKRNNVSFNRALSIVTALLDTLEYTNESFNYFHLDLTPENILFVEEQYETYIIDYTGAFCEQYEGYDCHEPLDNINPVLLQHKLLCKLFDNITYPFYENVSQASDSMWQHYLELKSSNSEITNFRHFKQIIKSVNQK